jgi:quinol monooxygenase YgiN
VSVTISESQRSGTVRRLRGAGAQLALRCILCAAAALAASHAAGADEPRHVVAYIDTLAEGQGPARAALIRYRDSSRREPGALAIELYREKDRNGYAIVEAWSGDRALTIHEKAASTRDLKHALEPLQAAPPDVRILDALFSTGDPTRASDPTLLVHVDVTWTSPEKYQRIAKDYVEGTGHEAGLAGLEILQETAPRKNHFTAMESWTSPEALDAHRRSAAWRSYRALLAPLLEALYDERRYLRLN